MSTACGSFGLAVNSIHAKKAKEDLLFFNRTKLIQPTKEQVLAYLREGGRWVGIFYLFANSDVTMEFQEHTFNIKEFNKTE